MRFRCVKFVIGLPRKQLQIHSVRMTIGQWEIPVLYALLRVVGRTVTRLSLSNYNNLNFYSECYPADLIREKYVSRQKTMLYLLIAFCVLLR